MDESDSLNHEMMLSSFDDMIPQTFMVDVKTTIL